MNTWHWRLTLVLVGWLLELYVLATSKVISGQGLACCASAQSWRFYSAAPLGNLAVSIMIRDSTQSHYPDQLAQDQDNATELDIGLWCQWPGLPGGQHYKVPMSVHCYKLIRILL